ncbi:hypothetical protein K458DRAFT_392398 [Lentithecium fluviatile CBS 122367]|uniref:PD-(D/E)XK nuclease-like domain-containing protein n=1 Tax=Lentithecium fluviatile CBS 122367 TaxID=1168545 RepID=A0A6G1IR56_9PLEO|nr:hypothetical protein K458DRAFT_392398 [Lentithecium fluviatile CBS 122367]
MSLPAIVPASSSQRSNSPKRRRADDSYDVRPEQSASQLGSGSPLTLNDKTAFLDEYPPVLVESLNGLEEAPPDHAERLGDRLAEGIDFGFIPQNLRDVIKDDPEVGHQTTKQTDFDRSGTRFIEELSTDETQSQSISPLYLSTIPASPNESGRRKPMDRKTDFVLSYSHRHPDISALYKRLDAVNRREIGHTLDTFTKRTALFSGFEVKPASGDYTEAELQMSIWIAASLRKKQELAQITQTLFEPAMIVEPALTIVGHEHSVYYAYPREDLVCGRSGVHVLGLD